MNLNELNSGDLQRKFDNSFAKVVSNMQDCSVPYDARREIVITMKFAQNEQRDSMAMDISVKEKLASQESAMTRLDIHRDSVSGQLQIVERTSGMRGQMEVDPETGEVIER